MGKTNQTLMRLVSKGKLDLSACGTHTNRDCWRRWEQEGHELSQPGYIFLFLKKEEVGWKGWQSRIGIKEVQSDLFEHFV